jgi:hypothetical protein
LRSLRSATAATDRRHHCPQKGRSQGSPYAVWISLVALDALCEERLIVEVAGQAGFLLGARPRSERGLLTELPRLGLVVRRLSGKFNGKSCPRTAPMGVFRVLGRVSPDRPPLVRRQMRMHLPSLRTHYFSPCIVGYARVTVAGLHRGSGYTARRRQQRRFVGALCAAHLTLTAGRAMAVRGTCPFRLGCRKWRRWTCQREPNAKALHTKK